MPHIKLFGSLRTLAYTTQIEVPGKSVREVLEGIDKVNPLLKEAILDGNNLRPHIRILITGKDIELGNGLDTSIEKDAQLAIFPAIAGGII